MAKYERNDYPVLACPLCTKKLDIRISKKSKPYCVCFDCGMQIFVRNETGISRLGKKTGFVLDDPLDRLLVRGRAERLAGLRSELRRVNREIERDFWDDHPELRERRDEILREIESLEG